MYKALIIPIPFNSASPWTNSWLLPNEIAWLAWDYSPMVESLADIYEAMGSISTPQGKWRVNKRYLSLLCMARTHSNSSDE